LFNSSEANARKELIDPALLQAGWDVSRKDQVGLEIPVDGTDPAAWKALEAKLRRIKDKAGDYSALVLACTTQPTFRQKIGALATGSSGSMKNISIEKSATLRTMVAPIKLQGKFANIVNSFERVRVQQREVLRQAEHLFQTLVRGVSKGEL